MRIAVTGPEGLMGRELCKLIDYIPISHRQMDITNELQVREVLRSVNPDLVVHLAAGVRTDGSDKQHTYDVNVLGTRNVARNTPRLLYISTEYVFDGTKGNYTEQDYPNPLQYYGLSKLLGEYESRTCPQAVVARLTFKPRPYRHSMVPTGMMTSGGYVDDMAKELKKAMDNFDKLPPIINIGIERRLLKDLALETREVGDVDINSLPIRIPLDASLDLSLWRKICPKD
jgi:dTDP-4-dehydrorhamnose reductase